MRAEVARYKSQSGNRRTDGDDCITSRANAVGNRARQLYKNISMLFLFPVKDGKLSTGVNATFNASCYG